MVFDVTMRVRGNPDAIRFGVIALCLYHMGLCSASDNIYFIVYALFIVVSVSFVSYMEFFAYVYYAVMGLEEDPYYEDDPLYNVPL